MMGYNVKKRKQLTIGLHLSYTTPMNCDFDGDENNVWDPQDLEAEAEVKYLFHVKHNIMSAEQNRPTVGLVMNAVTGAFLLSHPGTVVEESLFETLVGMISERDGLPTLGARLRKYGVPLRSGRALLSALFPPDFHYEQKGVIINEGVLISGQLKKSHVGPSQRSIIQDLWKQYRSERTSAFLTDAPWVINKWIMERGFSVGVLDCVKLAVDEATGEEYDKNRRIMQKELAKIYVQLEALGGKIDDPLEETFRQRQINNLLNVATGVGLRLAKKSLAKDNSIGVMTELGAGTKGALANIGQMMGSVGQQYYRGQRLRPTLSGGTRLLPTFDYNDNSAEANGFIPQSFFTGVKPEGLFFLQEGGREGLLDTALKTAETGSMQNRMIKAFENVIVGYDGSIRNTVGVLFSPCYNAGYDISEQLETGTKKTVSFIDIASTVSRLNVKRGWIKKGHDKTVLEGRSRQDPAAVDPVLDPIAEPLPSPPQYPPVDVAIPPTPVAFRRPITRFEKTRIIGTRAVQLSYDAPPLIDPEGEVDPLVIAEREYYTGQLPIYIIRKYPDGSYEKVYPTPEKILE
jgi:DNA-directed RNA polymerase beta' subunit/DNA-directed RNA polymerase subunit K/omega